MPSSAPPAAPAAKVTLQARKQELVRDALWTAAIDLFATKGFDETTVDDIAAAAGTSRRTFFRHFASKRDLMGQPVLSFGAALRQAIESSPAKSPPAALFRHVVTEVARRSAADARTHQLMEIAARYPAAREAQLSRGAELQDLLAEAFARRCRDELTAQALASLTLAAISLAHRAWFVSGKRDIVTTVEHVLARFSSILSEQRLSP